MNSSSMKVFFWIILMALFNKSHASELMHRVLLEHEKKNNSFVWEELKLNLFDELIVSWNAERPLKGFYLVQVSVFTSEWSPWIDYAFWGKEDQHTFKKELGNLGIQVNQDVIEVFGDTKASGFKIRVLANEKGSLEELRSLHISLIDQSEHVIHFIPSSESIFIDLKVIGLSQMTLNDERSLRLCSPTSTTAVINFLSGTLTLSPIEFANSVVDSAFDIYGNWVLNTAEASHLLGKSWHCFVTQLMSFNQIIDQLIKGYPVVVSIKGPLKGSALPYASGHLIVVTGYDSKNQEVFCMDPAFPTDDLTHVKYHLNDFLMAWSRKQGIAYIFNHSHSSNVGE